jgi:signal transduction histidine kinase/CheY-like chemotaxis protein
MAPARDTSVRFGLVGTGADLVKAIQALQGLSGAEIVVIADPSDRSEGARLAHSLKLPVVKNLSEVYSAKTKANVVVEVSGDQRQYERLLQIKPPSVEVLSVRGARLLIQLITGGAPGISAGSASAPAAPAVDAPDHIAALAEAFRSALVEGASPAEAAKALAPAVAAAAGMEFFAVAVPKGTSVSWAVPPGRGDPLSLIPFEQLTQALAQREPVWLSRPARLLGVAGLCPLRVGDAALGVLAVGRLPDRPASPRELAALRLGADLLASALHRTRPAATPLEVVKEVPVEVVREVLKEIPIEVVKEVPVEVVKEVVREVPIEVVREVETPVEVVKEIIREVPVEIFKEVVREGPGEVVREVAPVDEGELRRRRRCLEEFQTAGTRVPVDLNDVVRRAVEQLQPAWREATALESGAIELVTQLGARTPVLGVEPEIREAVVQVVTNAVDAMPHGGKLTIRTSSEAGQGIVAVSDTGPGMAESVKRRAFEPFFSTKGAGGLGLGLSMVRAIMARHGGDASIESEPGNGTTVTLRAPTGDEAPPVESEREAVPALLVVEDDEAVRTTLAETLEGAGYAVARAASGLEGIAKVRGRGRPFDLVLTDLGMPDVPGWEVVEAAKQLDTGTPVVVISGFDWHRAARRAKDLKVDLVISKPFDLPEVLDSVRGLLSGRKTA